jgi:GH24 family phage-related lysozyme (muramidase)
MIDGHAYTAQFEAPGGKPVLKVYPDPLTGKEPWTVGLGHTGPDVHQGDTWTEEHCWTAFYKDYATAQIAATHLMGASVWAGLGVPRQCVMTDLCFNPGPTRLAGFHHMLAAIDDGKWQTAHDELLDSAYAKQVKTRAKINANTLLTGQFPETLV